MSNPPRPPIPSSTSTNPQLPPAPVIPNTKVNLFQYGAPAKLSAFEKAQKEAEEKKRRDEEEARAVYDDFVKSFEGDQRGGQEFVGQAPVGLRGGKRHFAPAAAAGRLSGHGQQDNIPQGKKRNLDTFLEELKRGHDTRDKHQKRIPPHMHGHTPGTATPDSRSNVVTEHVLVVANLPPNMSEMALRAILANEVEEDVKITLGGSSLGTNVRESMEAELKFGTAKAISAVRKLLEGYYLGQGYFAQPLSTTPTATQDTEESYYGAKGAEVESALQFRPPPTTIGGGAGAFTRVPPPPTNRPSTAPGKLEIRVEKPRDIKVRRRIHSVVENVLKYGPEFESLLMHRERENIEYAWLWPVSPLVHSEAGDLHRYYRWKVWSALSHQAVDHAPKPIFANGTPWRPPPPLVENDTEDEDEADQDQATIATSRTGILGPRARRRLVWLVRRLDVSRRGTIAAAMAYCLGRADAAEEVVEVLCAACRSTKASPGVLLARLFLVSDILHNSSTPIKDAWRYRAAFEESLGRVFGYLGDVYRGFEGGRIKAKTWEERVLGVVGVWEGWMMFSAGVLGGFRGWLRGEVGEGEREAATGAGEREVAEGVDGKEGEVKVKQGGWKTVGGASVPHSIAAVPTQSSTGNVNVDGDESIDVDGGPMNTADIDIDGAPLYLDDDDDIDDIDGVPLDLDVDDDEELDVDGQPMSISDEPAEPTPTFAPIPVPVPAPTPTLSLGGLKPGGIKLGLGGKAGVKMQLGGISRVKKVKAPSGGGVGGMFGDREDGE
ncbi:hypothetical protein SAICODRAFT_189112 [Saitoella complicata NRRL Y-17804]|uniref:CID domain-containing protein n=1 Tax=Saitoella complicata (strain BCRC 22490 / CBS 7301 / JCM 7358 / NBRC 10748 / NRRL Y-17804) TaxID=698492 RepID=A0A0E9NDY8_SAICN|nr:uncharacterized protein SAICODRAFT_189112 [Saitoella complicata NRRL Y-17804]ODQ49951.1 hypothetical protein SAICODRAFT_189112 [Saitoella complicata NRRL Y-17804]GAO47625.1 hypothetical protein G7K_1825-t1 [Saitoella complicata NRRL Y-17804]